MVNDRIGNNLSASKNKFFCAFYFDSTRHFYMRSATVVVVFSYFQGDVCVVDV